VNKKDGAGLPQGRPLPNSYWVIPGRFLAGEHPSSLGTIQAQERISRLFGAGLDYFVDLTEQGEQPEYRHFLPRQAEYLRSPIADTGVPANVSQTQAVLSAIRGALARERGIYVHCRAGIGRTGLVVGCFLADEPDAGKSVLKRLNLLWRQSARSETWPRIPQTAEQADYIRHWPKLRVRK
jgi:hypothetical protein